MKLTTDDPACRADRSSGLAVLDRRRPGNALKQWAVLLAIPGLLFSAAPAIADTPVTLYQSLAGNINITGTGGTLRTNPDGTNSCSVTNNGSMQLLGLPAGATVLKAYLYWAGSGGDPVGGAGTDYNVTFNGTAITADRTYTASYNNAGNILYFFGGVKDVTSQVTANGVYTFANLTVQAADVAGGGTYCSSAAVLSAFSLVVVYTDPTEILHVVNIWEGFQSYRGGAITLTPTNFTVPTPAPVTALSSRILVLTWEGDSGNSGALGGFNENLTFCSPTPCAGTALTNVYNPVNNQFNSTVDIPPNGPFSGIDTIWGLDLDMYDITGSVPAAAASAQSVYSSGGDLVILANQTMSIPNVAVADLAITKSHSGSFTVATNGTYTLGVTNNGPSSAAGTITVTDTLPAGLTYVSAAGTGWACGAVGQTVTCTRAGPLANGAAAPSITLTVSVGVAAYPSVTNTASVSNPTFDNISANNTATDLTTVITSNFSTSTKTWQDLNGGDQNPGDVIQYTITLIETAGVAAAGVSVTDNIPANVTAAGFTVISTPAGSTNSSTGAGTGANGTGYLNITNIAVPANGSVTIVFNVTVGAVAPGTLINNTATITNPLGPAATPVASTITVSQSLIPVTGNKQIYLYGAVASPYTMSRTPTPGAPTTAAIAALGGSALWNGNNPVALQLNDTITAANASIYIGASTNAIRTVEVRLYCSSNAAVYADWGGATGTNLAPNPPVFPAVTLYNFALTGNLPMTCNAGNYWVLQVFNRTTTAGRTITVAPVSAGNISQVILTSSNVINVNSVTAYNTVYPGVGLLASWTTSTVYLRAVVSDPFGSFDINASNNATTQPKITITDPTGSVKVSAVAMPQVADSGAATKTFEYAFTPTAPAASGFWTASVTAPEGTEGTVSDTGVGTFKVMPSLLVLKSVQTFSDPVNNITNPKAIPGAVMLYTVQVTNTSYGSVDNNTTVITDPIPANTSMCVSTLCSNPPLAFACSAAPACGLTFNYLTNVAYTCAAPIAPCPQTDASGYGANVTSITINPIGMFNGAPSPQNTNFSVTFKVKVN